MCSSVHTVTRLQGEQLVLHFPHGKYLFSSSWQLDQQCSPTSWVLGESFPQARRLGSETNHSPPYRTKIMNTQNYASTTPYISFLWYIKYDGKFMFYLVTEFPKPLDNLSQKIETNLNNLIQSNINLLVRFCCFTFCQVILNHVSLTTDLMLCLPVTLFSPKFMSD